ncbi:MAG: hypothetical protein V2I33_17170 [Kangiellaceae bacterium]|jgi:uncharacterized protein YkuJ|nr:hypothetical protein [Kangiellaceae bacterium]
MPFNNEYRVTIRVHSSFNRGANSASAYTYEKNGVVMPTASLNPIDNVINLIVANDSDTD